MLLKGTTLAGATSPRNRASAVVVDAAPQTELIVGALRVVVGRVLDRLVVTGLVVRLGCIAVHNIYLPEL